jgi:hypothetical protein
MAWRQGMRMLELGTATTVADPSHGLAKTNRLGYYAYTVSGRAISGYGLRQ